MAAVRSAGPGAGVPVGARGADAAPRPGIGALILFRSQPGELAEPDRRAAQALADVATIGILQHRTARHTAEVNEQLRHALSSWVVIEQAKGILAHYGRLDMDAAFTALRGHARRHQLRLTDLAQALVDGQRPPADVLGDRPHDHSWVSRLLS